MSVIVLARASNVLVTILTKIVIAIYYNSISNIAKMDVGPVPVVSEAHGGVRGKPRWNARTAPC